LSNAGFGSMVLRLPGASSRPTTPPLL
jgi:hypothetical protein